ncbi:uncharacterized protein LOC114357859 [Ostrinia furnacalis]|uniref:uncharacterized protein LOC114357859 n=1 Tax=Ostrinia furnacalis TaxID=93504 RepID=UPI00103DD7C2|nr:uncharacterized protein LOC114357859 [Ostrinia furnacalis]
MNSRSSVNETNLVNFSTDLSTLNQLDTKDGLLSFPFDHIYACHSETSDRRQALQLDKEVEISTHCVVSEEKDLVVTSEVSRLSGQLAASESQNKRLKDLLIYHLDLIQQQNELITKREKLYQALKQENDTLKTKLNRRVSTVSQRHSNPPPLVHVPPGGLPPPTPVVPPVTSTVVKAEPGPPAQIMLNSFTELLLPDTRTNSFLYDSDLNKNKPFGQDSFEISRGTEDVSTFLQGNLGVSSILDNNLNRDNFTMIENKRTPFVTNKKEIMTEPRSEALYTVTSNSGNPVIQRIQRNKRRTSSALGSLSRMSKTPVAKPEVSESSKMFDDDKFSPFSINKKSKMINTYGKSKNAINKRTSQFTGSLSDRLQLIDTTPTGEDPYQLGEADLREQSPIPKLMFQKSNHSRMKMSADGTMEAAPTRRIYDPAETTVKPTPKTKLDRFHMPSTYVQPPERKKEVKTLIIQEPDLDIVKTETEIDWRIYNPNKPGNETSLCDFSYGENPNNLASNILPSLDSVEFQELFAPSSPLRLENLNSVEYNTTVDQSVLDKSTKRTVRTHSLMGSNLLGGEPGQVSMPGMLDSKRGRKRALSTTGLGKNAKNQNIPKVPGAPPKPKPVKGKAACRGKKSPTPGMVTKKPYHTLVGDPDLSWYLGLDPDVKLEDVDQTGDSKVSTVEVPRWREKPYTSTYTLEGTENLDDRVFEKRHQKLEAEERRQLRWHMRRIREQRHVERLRQRQRDPWGGGARAPAVYTVWPQPQRDVRFIEITDTLPVMAFGEILPALPNADFMLPWVRTSKALKRSKRSKTLH